MPIKINGENGTLCSSDNNSEEAIYNEKNSKSSKRSHGHGSHKKSSSKHHRHSHKHRSSPPDSGGSSGGSNSGDAVHAIDHELLGGAGNNVHEHDDDMSNIYDSPKVPPIPVVMTTTSMSELVAPSAAVVTAAAAPAAAAAANKQPHHDNSCNGGGGGSEVIAADHLNAATTETLQKEEVVYDVPRSNPRKVDQNKKEAIYVNNIIHQQQRETNSQSENYEIDNTYDVPRTNTTASTVKVSPFFPNYILFYRGVGTGWAIAPTYQV